MRVADEEVDSGADLLIAGDMGIGNTTVAAALVAVLLELQPLDVVGTGTGIDDDAWARKVGALRDATYRGRAVREDPLAVLRTVGSADTAAMTGFLVQAAARRTPVLLDGVVSCACALVARRLVDSSSHWWLAGHRSTEPSQHRVLDVLGLEPLVDLGMRLGEGTGALTALPILRAAQAMCAEMGLLADLLPPDPRPGCPPTRREPTGAPARRAAAGHRHADRGAGAAARRSVDRRRRPGTAMALAWLVAAAARGAGGPAVLGRAGAGRAAAAGRGRRPSARWRCPAAACTWTAWRTPPTGWPPATTASARWR